ncbi:MAG: hypothetical protein AVDCRST_MAG41-3741, partial [uncultured Corynebacteriales bacterium]
AAISESFRPEATPFVRRGRPREAQVARPVPGEARRKGGLRPAVDQPGGECGVLAVPRPGVQARRCPRHEPVGPLRRVRPRRLGQPGTARGRAPRAPQGEPSAGGARGQRL